MDAAFDDWLRRLGESLGLDRLMLVRVSPNRQMAAVSHTWDGAGRDHAAARLRESRAGRGGELALAAA